MNKQPNRTLVGYVDAAALTRAEWSFVKQSFPTANVQTILPLTRTFDSIDVARAAQESLDAHFQGGAHWFDLQPDLPCLLEASDAVGLLSTHVPRSDDRW